VLVEVVVVGASVVVLEVVVVAVRA